MDRPATLRLAGRGYDRDECKPFGAEFVKSAEIFEQGIDVVLKAWNSSGPWSRKGSHCDIPATTITPLAVQQPIAFYVASFSKTGADIPAQRGLDMIYARFAVGVIFGGLDKAVNDCRAARVKTGTQPGRAMCSCFIFIADDEKADDYGRQAQLDYISHCVLHAIPTRQTLAPIPAQR